MRIGLRSVWSHSPRPFPWLMRYRTAGPLTQPFLDKVSFPDDAALTSIDYISGLGVEEASRVHLPRPAQEARTIHLQGCGNTPHPSSFRTCNPLEN